MSTTKPPELKQRPGGEHERGEKQVKGFVCCALSAVEREGDENKRRLRACTFRLVLGGYAVLLSLIAPSAGRDWREAAGVMLAREAANLHVRHW